MKKWNLIELTIHKNKGKILNGKNTEVTGETEGHFGQHRMNICMPEDKPSPQGLPDIKPEDQ